MYTVIKNEKGAAEALRSVLKILLEKKIVDGVFVAAKTPYSQLPMPALMTDPEKLEHAEPLAPVASFNAARQAATLLRTDARKKLAFVLRPCEIRALVELVKLKQAMLDNAVIIGLECAGRLEPSAYLEQLEKHPDFSGTFYESDEFKAMVCTACSACEQFVPDMADVVVSLYGSDLKGGVGIYSKSETGKEILNQLGSGTEEMPPAHEPEISKAYEKRKAVHDALVEETSEKINSIEKFEQVIANCLNCYNCRVACPVCYCKECVFLTDVFAHEPDLLIRRAQKKGMIKLPVETTMFHITRLAHIGHACVACGHCSSVCPSNIPVADFFITVGSKVQELFDYVPGRDVNEAIPYLVFEAEK